MKAVRVLQFGPPNVITSDDLPRPEPAPGQMLVRVKAAGVGNWDALVREGKIPNESLPLILGYELSGIVEVLGPEVSGFNTGDEVYGATNDQLTGAYAEYALPSAKKMAQKPKTLNFVEAASAPIVTVTAWQMLFDYAQVSAGQTVLIHGAAGNVGAYAVQLARQAGLHVIATAASADLEYVRRLGAEKVVDYKKERFEETVTGVDVVLDTVGGDTQQRSLQVLKPGGILVSVVSPVPETAQKRYGIRAAYFYVDVTTARLNMIAELFDSGKLVTDVGTVLPLEKARIAHEMLGGAPHKRGKIVLSIAQVAKAIPLMTKNLPDLPGKEGLVETVVLAPGEVIPEHRHNADVFAYVLDGSIITQVKGGKPQTVHAGEVFYESPTDVHLGSRNASTTQPAKLLVFFVKNIGAPPFVGKANATHQSS